MLVRRLASWGATEKLHNKAIYEGWQVGRQQKNQQYMKEGCPFLGQPFY